MRVRRPGLDRPYRAWGYPLTPAAFLAVNAFILVYVFREKPVESILGLLTIAAGLVLYFASLRFTAPRKENS